MDAIEAERLHAALALSPALQEARWCVDAAARPQRCFTHINVGGTVALSRFAAALRPLCTSIHGAPAAEGESAAALVTTLLYGGLGPVSWVVMYHGTTAPNAKSIAQRGLDPDMRGTGHGQAHGPGEYLATTVPEAAPYCAAPHRSREASHGAEVGHRAEEGERCGRCGNPCGRCVVLVVLEAPGVSVADVARGTARVASTATATPCLPVAWFPGCVATLL